MILTMNFTTALRMTTIIINREIAAREIHISITPFYSPSACDDLNLTLAHVSNNTFPVVHHKS